MAIGSRLRGIIDELIATGYPDQVAERIATGDLPMDTASRMQRADDLGFDPTVYYKGGGERGKGRLLALEDRSRPFFATSDPMLANSYNQVQGVEQVGAMYPLRIDTRDFATVDARGQGYRDIYRPTLTDSEGYALIDSGYVVDPRVYPNRISPEALTYSTDELAAAARQANAPGVIINDVVDLGFNYGSLDDAMQQSKGLRASDYVRLLDEQGANVIAVNPDAGDGMNKVRSLFAAFDPEYKGSNILGFQGGSQSPSLLDATAQSAVGAASLVSPETPESELYEGLTDKMIDYLTEQMGGSEEDRERAEYISMGMDFLPFVGAAKGVSETFDAYKNDDALGMALGAGGILAGLIPFGRGAYKSALGIAEDAPVVTRDTGLLQRVGDPESVNTMKLDVEPGVELAPSRLLSAEDLEGRGFVSGMADTSKGDLSRVVSVNDQPVDMVRFGGQDYMRQPQNVEQGILWASDAGAVTGLTNAAKAARALPGVNRSPVYVPYQMGATSTDFATMTSDIMVPIARQNMKKADKKALDKRIREGAGTKKNEFKPQPDWPGIDSPKADEWLANAGGNRKAITKAIDEFRDSAGINLSQARAAIVDPSQLTPRVGNLRQAGVLDLAKPAQPGIHPSYNTDLMGSYLGEFGEGANLLSDLNPLIRSSGDPFVPAMIDRGHNLTGAKLPAPVGKAMQAGLIGAFDQATLDELIKKGLIAP